MVIIWKYQKASRATCSQRVWDTWTRKYM